MSDDDASRPTRDTPASASPHQDTELQALYETLADISALLAPDTVLQSITARTRSALHADLCYFSILDPHGEEHSARISSSNDQDWLHEDFVRLEPNQGVAGRVAATREVFSSSDYLNDPQLQHDPSIDELVMREGIVSIGGAPLLNGEHLFGVLLVAFRERHVFTAKELVFMQVIAGHAAVALARARLISDLERQNAELARALEEVQEQAARIDAAQEQHEELTGLVLAGAEARVVVRRLGELIGFEVTHVEHEDMADQIDLDVAVEVRAGARRFGHLVLRGVTHINGQQRVILGRGANVIALSRLLEVSMLDTDSRSRIDLLTDLLAGRVGGEAAELRAQTVLGHEWKRATSIACASVDGSRSEVEAAGRLIAQRWGGLFVVDHASAAVLAPTLDSAQLAREFEAELRSREVLAFLGHAHDNSGLKSVRDLHRDASYVAEALESLRSDLRVSSSTELGIVGLVLGARQDGASSLIARTLGPVIEYDRKRRTELERTLRAYFASSGILTETARALLVHPKTVSQRIDRIRTLLGPTALEGDRAMEIFIALRLRSILDAQPER